MLPVKLHIELKPSPLLFCWLLLLHGIAATICLLYLPLWLCIVALLLLVAGLLLSLRRRILLRGTAAVTALRFSPAQWQLAGHGWQAEAHLTAATVWPLLVALQFRETAGGRRRQVLVMRDMLDLQAFTQLKVAARFAPLSV